MPTHRSQSRKINRQNKAWIRTWCTRETEPTPPAAPLTLEEIVERDRRAVIDYDQKSRSSGRYHRLTCERVGPPRTLATPEQLQQNEAELLRKAGLDIDIESPLLPPSLLDDKISEQEPFDLEILWPALLR